MDHKPCEICKTKTKVECMQCRKFYCNNLTSGNMSHILLHLTKCSHDEVKVVEPLMCQKCKSNNVFDLGVISDRLPLFEVTVRKTVECETNEDIEAVMPNVFDRLVCRFCCNCDGYASIIYDGSIIESFVSSYTLKNADTDICDKEKKAVDLPKVKLVYSQKEYIEIYTVLLNYEHELESKNAKHCSVKDVNVRFESRTENIRQFLSETDMIETTSYYLYADIGTATKYGHCGGIVNLVSKTSSIYGVMMNHVKSNELKVKVCKINGNININAKYILTFNPFPCPKARRFMGLTRLNKIDYTLVQYICGIGIEREYRKIEIAHTDKNIITDIPGLPKLNYAQLLSIRYALQNKLVLIQGPPGTGKTVTAAAIAYNMLKMNTRRKILVVANNNTAVNNITEKLYLTGLNVVRVVSHIRGSFDDDLSFISSNHLARMSYYENLRKNNNEIIEENHKNIPEKILIEYEKSVIRSADVVTTTMISSGKQIFEGCYFPVVIFDEATQYVEPINLIPLVHGCKTLILIGDHKQLGPFVPDENLERAGFDQTLFQRFIRLKYTPILLDIQYRMHPSLSYLPSRLFYSNKLKNGVDSRERRSSLDLPFPTFFYGCFGREEIFSNGLSCVNQLEADQCISVVKFLIDSNVNEKDIGIITAYEGQRNLLLRKLSAFNLDFLEIKNVDGYQGREKEYIIFCTVRSNSNQGVGFLSDTRRINVGLTRAKRGLVIIGNPYKLSTNSVWYSVVKFYNDNDLMFAGDISNLGHIQLMI